MDIIGHLKRTVTPKILGENRTSQSENLLDQFYSIFAARLADDETYGRFSGKQIADDDNLFFDNVWTDDAQRNTLSRELASSHDIDDATAKSLVATAAPITYNELNSLAGSTPVPQFLRENLSTYRDHIPDWAMTLIPAGLLVSEPAGKRISDTVSTAPLEREEEKGGSFMKALLPIIGLILLAGLVWAVLKGCQDNETTAVVDQPPVVQEEGVEPLSVVSDVEPASLSISSGEGNMLYACRTTVGNEGLRESVLASVSEVFGDEADKCRVDLDDSFATEMAAAPVLTEVLQLIKDTPNASAIIKGDTIALNSEDPDELAALVENVKAITPDLNVIAEGPLDIENEINESLAAADAALNNLNSESDPRDVARALSIQVINFELDKAFIPEVNKPFLDRAAKLIQEVPDLNLMIIGHTDSQASDEYNMELSRERAESVRDYLIAQGVDAEKLHTKGMGESDPIATNETERGRFRNRRIEFTVYDESMDEGGIKVAPDTSIAPADADTADGTAMANDTHNVINPTTNNTTIDPDLNPLDNNNDDVMPDGDDELLTADPDLNPLDDNNDDVLPDGDDVILGDGTTN